MFVVETIKESLLKILHNENNNSYIEFEHNYNGGYDTANSRLLQCIYSYCTVSGKRTKLTLELMIGMANMACFATKDERYIILMGGYWNHNMFGSFMHDRIYVIDLQCMQVRECNVRCPRNARFYGLVMSNELKENLAVFGFVRKCWNECEMGMDLYPPRYIIKLIQLWFVDEFVHLFEKTTENHWKISVDDILKNLI